MRKLDTTITRPADDHERRYLMPARQYLEANALGRPTLAEAARTVYLSPFHFCRRFRVAFGVSTRGLVIARRIEEAKRLMLDGESLLEVAVRCGFCDQAYFTTRFRTSVGHTPAEWLKAQRAAGGGN